jgi:hypothetical protein
MQNFRAVSGRKELIEISLEVCRLKHRNCNIANFFARYISFAQSSVLKLYIKIEITYFYQKFHKTIFT